MKLRARLFTSHVGVVAAGAAVTAACALFSFHNYVINTHRADLAARTTALAASVGEGLLERNLVRLNTIVARYGAQEDIWIRVISTDGSLISSSSPEADGASVDWRQVPGVAAALAGNRNDSIGPGIGTNEQRLHNNQPLTQNGRIIGAIRVSRTLAGLQRQDRHTLMVLLVVLAGVLAAAALASLYISRALAAPIARMRDLAVGIGEGQFDRRIDLTTKDELGELATALNLMCARLAAVEEERRTFLARSSHELRTPVTNVQASLEALESGAADDPALRKRFLATALLETRRMATLVRQLLDLGGLEAGVTVVESRSLDARRLVENVVQSTAVRFQVAQVNVELSLAPVVPTTGDPYRLQQVLLNILDNALRFSPRGGTVRISLTSDQGATAIAIADQGPGFSSVDLPRIFDQFFTSSGDPAAGTGLGLAIARRIMDAHRGTIAADNGPGGGAVVQIRLPHRPDAAAGIAEDEGSRVGRITSKFFPT